MASVGVSAPGQEIFLLALVAAMTSGCRLGLTTNSAPASMVAWAWSAVVTVPEPSRSFGAVFLLEFLEQIDGAGNGHGDFNDGDAAGDHGFDDGAALGDAFGAQNGNEADAFDDFLGGFRHWFPLER